VYAGYTMSEPKPEAEMDIEERFFGVFGREMTTEERRCFCLTERKPVKREEPQR